MNTSNQNTDTDHRPWLKFYDSGVPRTLVYPASPLWELVRTSAEAHPTTIAVDFFGYTFTYAELWDGVQRFAHALQALGIKKGDRVALMLPNCPQFVIAFYGALLAGATVIAVNPLYTSRELEQVLKDSATETLVMLDAKFPVFREIAATTQVKRTIVTGIQDYLPFAKQLLYPLKAKKEGTWADIKPAPNIFFFKRLLVKYSPAPSHVEVRPADDVAMLLYTGGTTGFPKAAMLTHFNLGANVLQTVAWTVGIETGKEVIGCALPFSQSYGLTAGLNYGIRIAATLLLFPDFSALEVAKAIQDKHITLFPGVPTMFAALNTLPTIVKYDLASIRCCLSGGAPLPSHVKQDFERLTGGKLLEGYGLSESSPVLTANVFHGLVREGSIGIPLPDTDIMILDDDGKPVATGEIGELAASGPQVMKGYWNRPEETVRALRSYNGRTWLLTGDMARMDEDGCFFLVDRKKDVILVDAYNVFPREVEEVLYEHPAVKEAVVAGIPDAFHGEYVKAYIVLQTEQTPSEQEIQEFCAERLAPFKVPKCVEFRAELPKTMLGKVLRRELVEEERKRLQANDSKTLERE